MVEKPSEEALVYQGSGMRYNGKVPASHIDLRKCI